MKKPDYLTLYVREARAQDDERLSELLIDAFVSTYAKKMPEVVVSERRIRDLRDMASKRRNYYVGVGEMDGEIVATGVVIPPGVEGSEAWIQGACDIRYLAIDPKWHGKGLAHQMMDALEAYAKKMGATRICLHVRQGALGVAKFYQKRGYARAPQGDINKLPEIYIEGFVKEI